MTLRITLCSIVLMSLKNILKDVPELKKEALYMVEVDDNKNIKKLYQIYNID